VRSLDTSAIVIIKGGRVAYEYGDTKQLSYLASARKSVLSMLYGKYVANGTIKLNKTLSDLGMSDVGGLLPIEEKATVKDLISARSGVYHLASNPGDLLGIAPKRGTVEPGTNWLYSNWDFNAAGAAFERMTGKDLRDALRDDVAVPIGMQDFQRKRQQKLGDLKRSQYPAYHMWFSTRDMARLGYLMLRNGKWKNRQVIPAEWVRESTTALTPLAEMKPDIRQKGPLGYGYMWWVWDGPFNSGPYKGAYSAMGAFGQYITVLPALDIVVAHKTLPVNRNVSQTELLELLDRVVGKKPASEDVLPILWRDGTAAAEARYQAIEANPKGRLAGASDLLAAALTLKRSGEYGRAIKVLEMNERLHPAKGPLLVRGLTALAETRALAGQTAAARADAQKAFELWAAWRPARLQYALLGGTLDGHTAKQMTAARTFEGTFRSSDTRYELRAADGRVWAQAFQDGDLVDEFSIMADKEGSFFVPEDGTVIRFTRDAAGKVVAVEGTRGKDTWTAKRTKG
jgi:CubicO group peptidase (beta-lactamase class C family)